MFDFITADNTFSLYPGATILHWFQGLLVGFLLMQSHVRKRWHFLAYAALATACFLAYEITEMVRINDNGDVDIANFTFMVHVGAVITGLYHLGRITYHVYRSRRERTRLSRRT